MAKELNRQIAAALFEMIEVKVTSTRVNPRQHKGNVVFVGYADFQIEVQGIPFLQMCGNSIKLMGENVHFDPKSERGKGDRTDHFFPHWFPMTGEARAVINEKIKRDDTIISMCHEAMNALTGQTSSVAS